MIRITTIFLSILLAAAAAGRYRAEESVRKTRATLQELEVSLAEEVRAIQVLRAEIAYLENPERLEKIADARTDLRPSGHEQTLSGLQLAEALGLESAAGAGGPAQTPGDVINNALAMAQVNDLR